MTYLHRQHATLLWLVMAGVVAFSIFMLLLAIRSEPAEMSETLVWILSAASVILIVTAWLFSSLSVEVADGEVRVRFGPGWPRRTIPVSDIHGASKVRNSWWYGWGIRYTPHGWLYNVQGLDAVELDLAGGRQFRIGTDEPRELARAVRLAAGLDAPE